jgi:molybdate transport system substrate-binding protein
MRRIAWALGFAGLVFGAASAQADELTVLSAAAVKQALGAAPTWFRASSGDTLRFIYGTAGETRDKALSGLAFQVVIAPPAVLADLVKKGKVAAGSREDLGEVFLAAATPNGAPTPDVSTVGALKAALLQAPSIGLADPKTGATSGIYLMKLMQKLGVAQTIAPRLKFFPDGAQAAQAAGRGEVALALGQKSEIMPAPGAKLIGLLPASVQLATIYSAGLAAAAQNDNSARRLMKFLQSARVRASFLRNGFDPPK